MSKERIRIRVERAINDPRVLLLRNERTFSIEELWCKSELELGKFFREIIHDSVMGLDQAEEEKTNK